MARRKRAPDCPDRSASEPLSEWRSCFAGWAAIGRYRYTSAVQELISAELDYYTELLLRTERFGAESLLASLAELMYGSGPSGGRVPDSSFYAEKAA